MRDTIEEPIATPRVHALVALMALQAARLPARVDAAGDLVLLDFQERSRWDERLIAIGFHHFDRSMSGDDVSEYHVQAAVADVQAAVAATHPPRPRFGARLNARAPNRDVVFCCGASKVAREFRPASSSGTIIARFFAR